MDTHAPLPTRPLPPLLPYVHTLSMTHVLPTPLQSSTHPLPLLPLQAQKMISTPMASTLLPSTHTPTHPHPYCPYAIQAYPLYSSTCPSTLYAYLYVFLYPLYLLYGYPSTFSSTCPHAPPQVIPNISTASSTGLDDPRVSPGSYSSPVCRCRSQNAESQGRRGQFSPIETQHGKTIKKTLRAHAVHRRF